MTIPFRQFHRSSRFFTKPTKPYYTFDCQFTQNNYEKKISNHQIQQFHWPEHFSFTPCIQQGPIYSFLIPNNQGFFFLGEFSPPGDMKKKGLSSHHATRGVSRWRLAIYIKTLILRQKKNYGNFKYFTMQKYNLKKKVL
jgi:hypothetical protein